MQLRVFTISLIATAVIAGYGSTALSAQSKPIEILSDSYGAGVPTNYTVLKGNVQITFSHPFFGQFTRAQVTAHLPSGIRTTRFVISNNAKTYRPILVTEDPHTTYSSAPNPVCAESRPLYEVAERVSLIESSARFEEAVKSKVSELKAARFFDKSCSQPTVPADELAAIENGVADVLVDQQPGRMGGNRYLQCLTDYGFAFEAGLIKAKVKQSLERTRSSFGVSVACSDKDDDVYATFDSQTGRIEMRLRGNPNREGYAATFFHELTHSIGVIEHSLVLPIENCCGLGKMCEQLAKMSAKSKINHQVASMPGLSELATRNAENFAYLSRASDGGTLSEIASRTLIQDDIEKSLSRFRDSESNLKTGENSRFQGRIAQCQIGFRSTERFGTLPYELLLNHLSPNAVAATCDDAALTDGVEYLKNTLPTNQAQDSELIQQLTRQLPGNSYQAAYLSGPTGVLAATESSSGKSQTTVAELAELGAKSGPINWSGPVTSGVDTDRLSQTVARPVAPQRGIASISDESEALNSANSRAHLGSADNRTDMTKGRATKLVDTVESAANRVVATLTPETVAKRAVARDEAYKQIRKDKGPQFVVFAAKDGPVQFVNIDGLDMSFPNPFLNNKPVTKSRAPSSTTASPGSVASANAGNQAEKLAGKNDTRNSSTAAANSGATSASTLEKALKKKDPEIENPNAKTPGLTAQSTRPQDGPSARVGGVSPNSKAKASAKNKSDPAKDANKSEKTLHFETQSELLKFLTATYRRVYDELENPKLSEALIRFNVLVKDHAGRKHGSLKPEVTLQYREDVDRLIQVRSPTSTLKIPQDPK